MNLNETTRAWIYRVLLAVQPLVVAYGLLNEQLAALWVSVIAAVLGTGLATLNTSTGRSTPWAPPKDDSGHAAVGGILSVVLVVVLIIILLRLV